MTAVEIHRVIDATLAHICALQSWIVEGFSDDQELA
jgi:hypothetical protein